VTLWDRVKRLYFEKFGYTDTLVEMVASSQILKLCASGASNKQIADVLEIDIDVVVEELEKWLYFSGWDEQLECNPLVVWRALDGKLVKGMAVHNFWFELPDEAHDIVLRYLKIEKIIMKEWL